MADLLDQPNETFAESSAAQRRRGASGMSTFLASRRLTARLKTNTTNPGRGLSNLLACGSPHCPADPLARR